MPPVPIQLPLRGTLAGFRRFSVAEYHRLTEIGILTEDDNLELLDGYLVLKMAHNLPHDGFLHRTLKRLLRLLPPGWDFRQQAALTLSFSEPEPDILIVREDRDDYTKRHPMAADVGLVVEVSDSALDSDRADKGPIYARDHIPRYWIVNIPDRQIEVYETPSGPASHPSYAQRQDYRLSDDIPFILGGNLVAMIAVRDLLG